MDTKNTLKFIKLFTFFLLIISFTVFGQDQIENGSSSDVNVNNVSDDGNSKSNTNDQKDLKDSDDVKDSDNSKSNTNDQKDLKDSDDVKDSDNSKSNTNDQKDLKDSDDVKDSDNLKDSDE